MATDTSSDTPVNSEIPLESITQNLSDNRQSEVVAPTNEHHVVSPTGEAHQSPTPHTGEGNDTDVVHNMSQEPISPNEGVTPTNHGVVGGDAGRFTNFMSRVREMRKKIPDDWGQKRTSDKVNESWGQRRSNL
jgi:hypothetical protein